MFTISIGCDKSGFEAKECLKIFLEDHGYKVLDEGTLDNVVCDYPVFAEKVSNDVAFGKAKFGVLICGSGEGMTIAANKVPGIRCGIGYNDETSVLLREHNDANIIAFGARFMSLDDIKRRVLIFLEASFVGAHHSKRIDLIKKMEHKMEE